MTTTSYGYNQTGGAAMASLTNTGTLSTPISGTYAVGNQLGTYITTPTYGTPYGNVCTTNIGFHDNTLLVQGNAVIGGELTIKGVNLADQLNAIERRLGILRPNPGLEEKWEKLKALGEEYRALEKELLEGEQIWDTLKK